MLYASLLHGVVSEVLHKSWLPCAAAVTTAVLLLQSSRSSCAAAACQLRELGPEGVL
jgi:hypothetical protein